jgi:AraC-like DNA-binding protein
MNTLESRELGSKGVSCRDLLHNSLLPHSPVRPSMSFSTSRTRVSQKTGVPAEMKPVPKNSWLRKAFSRLPRDLDLKRPIKKGRIKNLDAIEERKSWRLFLPLEGILELNDGVHIAPGEVLLLPQGWPFISTKLPEQWLEIAVWTLRINYLLYRKNDKIQELLLECSAGSTARKEITHYLSEIIKDQDSRDPIGRRTHALLDLLLLRLIDFSDGTEMRTFLKLKGRQRFNQAISLIQSHMSRPLTSGQAARELNCSQQLLTQLIQRQRKMRFTELLNFYRMEGARKLLQTSSLSIHELTQACGLSNPSHFSQIFKKHCGLSPKQWRDQWLANSHAPKIRAQLMVTFGLVQLQPVPEPTQAVPNTGKYCTFLISNADDRPYEIYWIDYEQQEILIHTLQPGDVHQLGAGTETYWRMKAQHRPIIHYLVPGKNCQAILRHDP